MALKHTNRLNNGVSLSMIQVMERRRVGVRGSVKHELHEIDCIEGVAAEANIGAEKLLASQLQSVKVWDVTCEWHERIAESTVLIVTDTDPCGNERKTHLEVVRANNRDNLFVYHDIIAKETSSDRG